MSADHEKAALQRRTRRVLRMVGELHQRGYQRVRIAPGMAPSGLHWRCAVVPASLVSPLHGARLASGADERLIAHYTSGQDNAYFGWTDATGATAADLADLFERRYPQIVAAGTGEDWAYAGWFQLVLGAARDGALPSAYDDGQTAPDAPYLTTVGVEPAPRLPLPPPVPGGTQPVVPTVPGGAELLWSTPESKRVMLRWVVPFSSQLQSVAGQPVPLRRHWVRAAGEAGYWFSEQTARQLYAMGNWRSWMAASFFLMVRRDLTDLSDWTAWRATWPSHGSRLQLYALASRDAVEPLLEGLHHGADPSAHWGALSLGGERCRQALRDERLPDPIDDPAAVEVREHGVAMLALADEVRGAVAAQRRLWQGP